MGIFEAWKATREPVAAEPEEVKPMALSALLDGDGPETRMFHDLIRLEAKAGDADADAALKAIAQKNVSAVDPNLFIKFHGRFTEHMRESAKAQKFLSPEMLAYLREGSSAFDSLISVFGEGADVAKKHVHEHLLFLSVNDPATFQQALQHIDAYKSARERSGKVAARALKELKLPAAAGDAILAIDDKKERRAKLREHITTNKYFGWAKTIDKYTGGIFSRFDAWLWDSKVNKVRSEAFAQIENDHEEIGAFLADSINSKPEVLAAFGRAARGLEADRSQSFKELQKLMQFDAALVDAWRNGGKPRDFNRLPQTGAAGVRSKDSVKADFLASWKPGYEAELLALDSYWAPVAKDFFDAHTFDLNKLS